MSRKFSNLWGSVDDPLQKIYELYGDCELGGGDIGVYRYDAYNLSVSGSGKTQVIFTLCPTPYTLDNLVLILYKSTFGGQQGFCSSENYIAHSTYRSCNGNLDELVANLAAGNYTLFVTHRRANIVDDEDGIIPYYLTATIDANRVNFNCIPDPRGPLGPGLEPTPSPTEPPTSCGPLVYDPHTYGFTGSLSAPGCTVPKEDPVNIEWIGVGSSGLAGWKWSPAVVMKAAGWRDPTKLEASSQNFKINGTCRLARDMDNDLPWNEKDHVRFSTCDRIDFVGSAHREEVAICPCPPNPRIPWCGVWHGVISYIAGRNAVATVFEEAGYNTELKLFPAPFSAGPQDCDGRIAQWDNVTVVITPGN